MTPAQQLAISQPCYLAGETVHPRYRSASGTWSLVLTVNAGHE
jgi:hypothetical protein